MTDDCLGIWLSTEGGAITWKAESLGQLLHEVLPGRTIEPLHLGVATVDDRVMPAGVAARWYDETEFLQTSGLPLTAAQLEERLDTYMVSLGAAEEPARALADYSREQQDFVLRCTSMVARTSSGMAFNFVSHVCAALRLMDEAGVEAWLLHCMDIYDTRGLHPAVAAFKDVDSYARDYKARTTTEREPFRFGPGRRVCSFLAAAIPFQVQGKGFVARASMRGPRAARTRGRVAMNGRSKRRPDR